MKKSNSSIWLILLSAFIISNASAQRKIIAGMVTYTASYDLPADQQQNAGFLPKTIVCYFRGDSSAAVVTQGVAVIKGVSVFKNNYHSMLIELPAAARKIVVVMSPEEVAVEKAANPEFTAVKGKEKQVINGFNCYKETITDTKSHAFYEIWLTNDIAMAPNSLSRLVSGFGGVPVRFVTFNRGIKINAELTEVKEMDVPAGFFTATPDYQAMSFAELQRLSASGN